MVKKQGVVPEIRIAVFGESGSGKTTLLSSYYGKQQSHNFEEVKGYGLLADNKAQGNLLLSNYHGMKEGHFPDGTGKFSTYTFSLRLKSYDKPAMKICWYDYPGKWWNTEPSDSEEAEDQRNCFSQLFQSQVGILLVDGVKLKLQEGSYLRTLFDQFRNEVRRQNIEARKSGYVVKPFPEQWIIAMSKADLFVEGDFSAKDFEKLVVQQAKDQLHNLSKEVCTEGETNTFGSYFLLLSSAKGTSNIVEDVEKTLGLELIAPLSLVSIIEKFAKMADQGKKFSVLAEFFDTVKFLSSMLESMGHLLPPKYQALSQLIRAIKLQEIADKSTEFFREKQKEASRQGKVLEATAGAMLAELHSDEGQKLYYCNQR